LSIEKYITPGWNRAAILRFPTNSAITVPTELSRLRGAFLNVF
jgi:hypothetical protein